MAAKESPNVLSFMSNQDQAFPIRFSGDRFVARFEAHQVVQLPASRM
jgi:hypothetical protein